MKNNAHIKPNLFIIGAMKAGTTSLHNYLNHHPDVFMCEPKEPGYFVEELNLDKGEAWYLDLFKDAGGAAIVGESSTHYSKYPSYKGVAERVAKYAPDARLVYVMRDPVQRALSQYWYSIDAAARRPDSRFHMETRQLATAVKEDHTYVDFSDYAMQLQHYMKYFDRDQIYTLTFESLIADPHRETNSLLEWLGVEGSLDESVFERQWNATPDELVKVKGRGLLQRFRVSRTWELISPLVPKSFRKMGVSMAVSSTDKDEGEDECAINYLRPIMQAKTENLVELLGREFPEWRTLYNN